MRGTIECIMGLAQDMYPTYTFKSAGQKFGFHGIIWFIKEYRQLFETE